MLRSRKLRPRRLRTAVGALVAGCALGGLASSASAACYFPSGNCTLWGSLPINSPTPWTGNYNSTSDFMAMLGDEPFNWLTVQIRTSPTGGNYQKSLFSTVNNWPHSGTANGWQHRCYQGGPQTGRQYRCGFN